MIMNREERLNKMIEELKQMRDEMILKSGYSSVEDYYKQLEQRKDKQDNSINTNDKQNIFIKTSDSVDKAA